MKKDIKIYLLCGKARSGKSTSSEIILKYYEDKNIKCIKTYIALYLKFYIQKFFGWDGKDETKPRELLQNLGTDIIRKEMNKNTFFIDRTIEDIEILSKFNDVFIIDDIRFPLEIQMIKEKFTNVKSIHIKRPEFVSELSEKQLKHATETALDNYDEYDYKIINDGSIEDLKEKVLNILGSD